MHSQKWFVLTGLARFGRGPAALAGRPPLFPFAAAPGAVSFPYPAVVSSSPVHLCRSSFSLSPSSAALLLPPSSSPASSSREVPSHVRRAPVSVPLLPPLSFQMYLNKKRSVCFVANTRKSVRFVVAQKKNEFFRTSHPSPICRLTWWRRRYRSSWYRRCLICRNKTNRIIV